MGELELSNECLTFISRTPNAFIVAKEKVKHDAQQSKKRKTSEPEAQEDPHEELELTPENSDE